MAKEKIHAVLSEYKHGRLKSSSGHTVTKTSQALAIALSEAREAGAKIPYRRSTRGSRPFSESEMTRGYRRVG